MSSSCIEQSCSENCCNYYGYCVNTTSTSSFRNTCYYNYDSNQMDYWIIGPIVFGVIFLLIIGCICFKRYQANKLAKDQIGMNTNTSPQTVVVEQNQNYAQPYNGENYQYNPQYQNYGQGTQPNYQTYQQPSYQQQNYQQPYLQSNQTYGAPYQQQGPINPPAYY